MLEVPTERIVELSVTRPDPKRERGPSSWGPDTDATEAHLPFKQSMTTTTFKITLKSEYQRGLSTGKFSKSFQLRARVAEQDKTRHQVCLPHSLLQIPTRAKQGVLGLAATCVRGFVNNFLRVPLGSREAAEKLWKSKKTVNKASYPSSGPSQ